MKAFPKKQQPFQTQQNKQPQIQHVFVYTKSIKIHYGTQTLELLICQDWTISKLKCLLIHLFPTLKFDQFQLLNGKYLLTQDSLVKQIDSSEITITKADCKGSFDQYYSRNMRKVMNQYDIKIQRSNFSTLHPCYLRPLSRTVNMARLNNFQPYVRDNPNQRLQNNEGMGLLGVFRIVGSILLYQLISSLASYFQIFVIILVFLLYLWIEHHVGQNNRRRIQRNIVQRHQLQNQQAYSHIQLIYTFIPTQQVEQHQDITAQQNNNITVGRYAQTQILMLSLVDGYSLQQQISTCTNQIQQQAQRVMAIQKLIDKNQEKKPIVNAVKGQSQNQQQEKVTNQNQSQLVQLKQDQSRPYLAKLVLFLAFIAQVSYCYILSLFPNWTVQTHILANQQKINRVFQYVQTLNPKKQAPSENKLKQQ